MIEWKPLRGGIYEASSRGDVRRAVGGKGARIGAILSQSIDSVGYPTVSLCINGQKSQCRVHVLVAEAFLGARPQGLFVNHIDGLKRNCAISNLEYVTRAENAAHAGRIGLIQSGENHWTHRARK